MTVLAGKKADDFVRWLNIAQFILPPKMSIEEAKNLFLRKVHEEDEIKHEGKSEEGL